MSGYSGSNPPKAVPTLSLQDATQLQRALLVAYSAADFKAKLQKLQEKEKDLYSMEYVKKLRELTLTVQAEVLPMYGFEGNRQGVIDMMNSFAPHMDYPEVAILAEQVNESLGIRTGGGAIPVSSGYENPLKADSALALQKELMALYSMDSTLEKIAAVQSFRGTAHYGHQVRHIVTPLAMGLCGKYGFDESAAGVGSMFRAINEFLINPAIHALANDINRLLVLPELPPLPTRPVQVCRFVPPVPGPDGFSPVQSNEVPESITYEASPGSTVSQLKKMIADSHGEKTEHVKLLIHKDGFWVTADENMIAPSHGLHVKGLSTLTQPPFSIAYSKKLLQALVAGFSDPGFQVSRWLIEPEESNESKTVAKKYHEGLRELALEVQAMVLPDYGLDPDARGVTQMVNAVGKAVEEDDEVAKLAKECNELLGLPQPAQWQTRTVTLVPLARNAEGKLQFTVAGDATVGDVKKQVAEAQSISPDSIKLIVEKGAGMQVTLQDTERAPRLMKVVCDSINWRLTRERALGLQHALLEAFSATDFQKSLKEGAEAPKGNQAPSDEYLKKIRNLTKDVWAGVLPKFGYSGDPRGAAQATADFDNFKGDDEIQKNARELNSALGLPQPDEVKTRTVRLVLTILKHITLDLDIPRRASVGDVLKQLSKREAVPPGQVKLIGEQKGAWVTLADKERPPDLMRVSGIDRFRPQPIEVDAAIRLQEELIAGFKADNFQQELSKLIGKYSHALNPQEERQMVGDVSKLAFSVQKDIVPKYGFEGTPRGVNMMLEAFEPFISSQEPKIVENAREINLLLGGAGRGFWRRT